MAVGDAKAGIVGVAPGAYASIRPPLGEEWVIHNIYFSDSVSVGVATSTSTLIFYVGYGRGALMGVNIHATNSYWVVVGNPGASSILVAYDGVQTR